MTETTEWLPRWASPPGRTIVVLLNQRGSTPDDLADILKVTPSTADAILASTVQMNDDLALRLSQSLGASQTFWLNRFHQYTEDSLRVEADSWAQQAPNELTTTLGWVEPSNSWLERIDRLISFFDVEDVREWRSQYGSILANTQYRRSHKFADNDVAVAAWLRQAQIQARTIHLSDFRIGDVRAMAASARALTWLSDPAYFVPRLTGLCADVGIAVALVKAPMGCPISGARHYTESGHPLICLSARYLTDDHLWFTFFHEIAHILLHGSTKTYVEDLDPEGGLSPDEIDEDEANSWAEEFILPTSIREKSSGTRLSHDHVRRLARDLRIAPGLLVGQFQVTGDLDFGYLNRLKRRYKWVGTSLEKA